MFSQLSRALLSLTLSFVLIGQGVLPVVDSCEMPNDNVVLMDMTSHDHAAMEHSQSMTMSQQDVSDHDCCDSIDCSCLSGTCSTTLIASLNHHLNEGIVQSSKISGVVTRLSSANSQLLIRPPIIS
ncbi:MAG: hypothetical protein KJO69_08260 [Gammaproteobacteria bacterium]|nr:hypothetical protein [Gammaproteobacteria bacterium]NNJ71810.1 hypothetical protein [Enterobacterales bacterium]